MVRDLPPRTDSAQSWAQVQDWVQKCASSHQRCRGGGRGLSATAGSAHTSTFQVPTRLIDVRHPHLPGDRVLLVETSAPTFTKERYVTLSHCWGDPEALDKFKLMPENKQERMSVARGGMALPGLPANFVDAIKVARRLGVRYIWIDALCIVQDGVDFKAEGPKMHSVYRNSFCNIAAAKSGRCTGGLFCSRALGGSVPGSVDASHCGDGNMLAGRVWDVVRSDIWTSGLLQAVLYTRGWVFQGLARLLPSLFSSPPW